MGALPPLRYLRKTTLLMAVVLFSFLSHRVYVSFNQSFFSEDRALASVKKKVNGVICRNIIEDEPFGVDSVFQENTRLYFYAQFQDTLLLHTSPVLQVWYLGADTILSKACVFKDGVCISSIRPDLLKAGKWSVDLVQEKKLWLSLEFLVGKL